MLYYIISCYIIYCIILCYAMWYDVMLYHTVLCCMMSYYIIISYYVMLCYCSIQYLTRGWWLAGPPRRTPSSASCLGGARAVCDRAHWASAAGRRGQGGRWGPTRAASPERRWDGRALRRRRRRGAGACEEGVAAPALPRPLVASRRSFQTTQAVVSRTPRSEPPACPSSQPPSSRLQPLLAGRRGRRTAGLPWRAEAARWPLGRRSVGGWPGRLARTARLGDFC